MSQSLLSKFRLRGWRTYLLTCFTKAICERDLKAIEILDEFVDNWYKDSHKMIDIDAIIDLYIPYTYKRKRADFINECIEKIMKSKHTRLSG